MPKIPRRNIADYKKDVQKARVRRNIKEMENMQMLKQKGEVYMKVRQNILMGYNDCSSSSNEGVEYGDEYVGTWTKNTEAVMDAIVVDENKDENVEAIAAATSTLDAHTECG
jgi:hypothetical protein